MCEPGETTEPSTLAPLITTPGETAELMASPIRPVSLCTNFAGGYGRSYVV